MIQALLRRVDDGTFRGDISADELKSGRSVVRPRP